MRKFDFRLFLPQEFFPNQEEARKLKAFTGDVELLGQTEKYMIEMLDFLTASAHIKCMIYKKKFKTRALEYEVEFSSVFLW